MGGIASALCLLLMLLTIIPIATYTMPALAGMVLIVVVIENGYSTAFCRCSSARTRRRRCCLSASSGTTRF